MSLTKRTWTTPIVGAHTLTFTGSVSGATTKLSIVFQAASAIYGVKSSINVYVNGTKQSCTWTTNKTESLVGSTYKTKMTSSQMTISKPFFTLKLADSSDGNVIYEETFSFYEIEKTPTAATCSGGVMDGTTKSKVTFTTSGTDATYKATFTLGSYSGSATSTTKELTYAIPISWCNAVPNATTGKANVVCQVLYGGQVYSSISTTITVSVPASVVPTVSSITLADKTGTPVPSAWNMFVQHQSGVRVSAITTGDGLYLCAKDGKLIANVPTISTGTPTSLTNGQFLYANNGKIGSRTIPLSALTDGVIKAGDSVTTANMVMNGYITSSSTELFFEVPLGKLITAASATLTAGTFTARTINGYAYNKASGSGGKYSGLTATDYTPVVALNKPSGTVRIRLLNSTKWTQSSGTVITNNTPVSVVGTLTLKFA